MTFRAVVFGLLSAALICSYTFFNDAILRQSLFVGNHMPISVYGGLLLFLLLINPLLRRVSRRFAAPPRWLRPMSGPELAVTLALALAACSVPYSSMLRLLDNMLILPHHYARTQPGWQWRDDDGTAHTVVELLPDCMTADVSREPSTVLDGYVQGLSTGNRHISFADIPWFAWVRTLGFWLPLIVVLSVALIGLAVAVHRQWADHERLPYPVAAFTRALLPESGQALGDVFRNRLFWVGTIGVLAFHLNNYACVWWPDYLIPIRRVFPLHPLARILPTFIRGPAGWQLMNVRIYFSGVAIAFLVATDVSLAVGLGPFFFAYVGGVLSKYGISMGAPTRFAPRIDRGIVYGAYVGTFLMILYTGRHYYLHLCRQAVGLKSNEQTDPAGVWGLRVFFLGLAIFVADLAMVGLDWQLALCYAVLAIVIFLVMGRIIAETGLFFIAPYLYPCAFISGLLGPQALGPKSLIIMFMLTCVLLLDARECLMPFVVNSLKLVEDCRVQIGRTAALAAVAVVLGFGVAVPITLYFQYDRGVNWQDSWASTMAPRFPGEETVRIRQRLLAQDQLKAAEARSGWARFAAPAPDRPALIAFACGLAGVLLLSVARLRLPNWPLHPVFFLVWSGWAGYMMAWSFVIGGCLKLAATKYGGAAGYQKLKPLMFGLIAGDMLAGIIIAIVGFVYYATTGKLPESYWVMPW